MNQTQRKRHEAERRWRRANPRQTMSNTRPSHYDHRPSRSASYGSSTNFVPPQRRQHSSDRSAPPHYQSQRRHSDTVQTLTKPTCRELALADQIHQLQKKLKDSEVERNRRSLSITSQVTVPATPKEAHKRKIDDPSDHEDAEKRDKSGDKQKEMPKRIVVPPPASRAVRQTQPPSAALGAPPLVAEVSQLIVPVAPLPVPRPEPLPPLQYLISPEYNPTPLPLLANITPERAEALRRALRGIYDQPSPPRPVPSPPRPVPSPPKPKSSSSSSSSSSVCTHHSVRSGSYSARYVPLPEHCNIVKGEAKAFPGWQDHILTPLAWFGRYIPISIPLGYPTRERPVASSREGSLQRDQPPDQVMPPRYEPVPISQPPAVVPVITAPSVLQQAPRIDDVLPPETPPAAAVAPVARAVKPVKLARRGISPVVTSPFSDNEPTPPAVIPRLPEHIKFTKSKPAPVEPKPGDALYLCPYHKENNCVCQRRAPKK